MFKCAGIMIVVIVSVIIAKVIDDGDDFVRDSILYFGGYVTGAIVWRKG